MKKCLFILLLFSAPSLFAQKAHTALSKSYSNAEIQSVLNDGKGTIQMLNYAVDHACYIIANPGKASQDAYQTIELKKTEPIRFTDYGLKILDHTQYFSIMGTNDLLVVKSSNILKLEMQNKK